MMVLRSLAVLAALMLSSIRADAEMLVRIGDIDGFGYETAPGFNAANRGPANGDGLGVLGNGDLLPDLNGDRSVQVGSNDEFDFRDASERDNLAVALGTGVTNATGTSGSIFTDISLTRTYDARSAAQQILVGGNPIDGLVRGRGGPFPSPPSNTLPNQPGFVFRFDVAKDAIAESTPIFFNLIFGDYDVFPAEVRITRANGTTQTLGVNRQPGNANGLIQAATTNLLFSDVFSDAGSAWRGSLLVDFVAPNEPYTAFDYVELSTTPLVFVPEPASLIGLGIGLLSLGAAGRLRPTRKSGARCRVAAGRI